MHQSLENLVKLYRICGELVPQPAVIIPKKFLGPDKPAAGPRKGPVLVVAGVEEPGTLDSLVGICME